MMASRVLPLALTLLAALYAEARAQFPFLPIDKVDDIAVYGQLGTLVGASPLERVNGGPFGRSTLRGVGFELFFDHGTVKQGYLKNWEVAFAVGYEQVAGFKAKEPSLDLHGAIQTVPSVSVYVSQSDFIKDGKGRSRERPIGVYVGLSTGLALTMNLRGYNSAGFQYSADGITYPLGAAVGVATSRGFLVELGYVYREFHSIDWKFPPGSPTSPAPALPTGWPRSINASTVTLAIGWEISLKKPAQSDAPAGPQGQGH